MRGAVAYKGLTSPDTFIGQYMIACEASETPYIYDFFGALWALSCTLGRDVYVARPVAPVFLNMYALFVAESGVTRKSSAVRMATNVVKQWLVNTQTRCLIVEGSTSAPRLEWDLHLAHLDYNASRAIITVSELVTLLGRGTNPGLVGLLTDLFDCPASRFSPGSLARGQTVLRNVFVTFLSASTPVWLLRSVDQAAVEGGFTSRCFIVAEEHRKQSVAWPTQSDQLARINVLASRLAVLANDARRVGGIQLHEKARAVFTRWYDTRPDSRDPYLASFGSREDAHVLRVAGLLAINDGGMIVEVRHIQHAIRIVADVKHRGALLFGGVQRVSPTLLAIDRLRARLVDAGMSGLSQSDCTMAVQRWLKARDVQTLLAIMHELNLVQRFEVALSARGRRKTVWRATAALAAPRVVDELWRRMEPT